LQNLTSFFTSNRDLCITPLDLKTMGFFLVPRLPGWSFQHPSTSHFKKVHRLFGEGENHHVFQRSRIEMVDFSEVTGGLRLVESPARRECCCLFTTYQWGRGPLFIGAMRRASSPEGTEETPPPLGKYEFCKALAIAYRVKI
jgi:hypothetical protein